MDPEQLSPTYSGSSGDDLLSSDDKTRTNDIVQFCYEQLDMLESDMHGLREINETLKLKNQEQELEIESLRNDLWTLTLYSTAEKQRLENDFNEKRELHERIKVLDLKIQNKLLEKVDKLEKSENTLKQVNFSLSSEVAELTAQNSAFTAPQRKGRSLRKCFLLFGAVALSATIGYMLGVKAGAS